MKNTHGASRPSKMCACVFKQWIVITPLPRLQKMPLKKENSSDSSRSHASIRLSRQFSPNYCIIHFFIQYKNSRSSHFPMSVSQWQLEGCFGCQCLRCWNCKLHDWLMTVIIVGHVFRLRSPAIKKITRSNTSQLWTHKICRSGVSSIWRKIGWAYGAPQFFFGQASLDTFFIPSISWPSKPCSAALEFQRATTFKKRFGQHFIFLSRCVSHPGWLWSLPAL